MHFIVNASPHKPLDVTLQVHRSHDVEEIMWHQCRIWPLTLTWGQWHTKCCPVPSCELCICKVWSCYISRFRRRYIYKKSDGPTHAWTGGWVDGQTDGRQKTLVRHWRHMVSSTSCDLLTCKVTSNGLWGDAFTIKCIIWPLIARRIYIFSCKCIFSKPI